MPGDTLAKMPATRWAKRASTAGCNAHHRLDQGAVGFDDHRLGWPPQLQDWLGALRVLYRRSHEATTTKSARAAPPMSELAVTDHSRLIGSDATN